MLKQILKVF